MSDDDLDVLRDIYVEKSLLFINCPESILVWRAYTDGILTKKEYFDWCMKNANNIGEVV
jgi:hypothetical protein